MNVLRASQREMQQARANGPVSEPIDENKAPEVAVFLVGLENNRLAELETADANFVEFEVLGRDTLQRVDIDLVLIGATVAVTV